MAKEGSIASSLTSLAIGGIVLGAGMWWLFSVDSTVATHSPPMRGQRRKIRR